MNITTKHACSAFFYIGNSQNHHCWCQFLPLCPEQEKETAWQKLCMMAEIKSAISGLLVQHFRPKNHPTPPNVIWSAFPLLFFSDNLEMGVNK